MMILGYDKTELHIDNWEDANILLEYLHTFGIPESKSLRHGGTIYDGGYSINRLEDGTYNIRYKNRQIAIMPNILAAIGAIEVDRDERKWFKDRPPPIFRNTDMIPEVAFGKDDKNVQAVKKAAARAARSFRKDEETHQSHVADLIKVLIDTDSARLRYWAGVVMIDNRFCGATGTGAYWAVASRLVNEIAQIELKERGDRWRAAGLGTFATIEAVKESGIENMETIQ